MPWSDDGETVVFRNNFKIPRGIVYPIMTVPFHDYEIPMYANPVSAFDTCQRSLSGALPDHAPGHPTLIRPLAAFMGLQLDAHLSLRPLMFNGHYHLL